MRDVWESVAAHAPDHGGTGSEDEAEQSHSACVYREANGRNRPFCPHGHGSMMMQATLQQISSGNARRAVPPQDSAWTGAMFDL